MKPIITMTQIIVKGFELLEKEKAYQQVDIIEKMKSLGIKISRSSFSNLINNKKVGTKVLKSASNGISTIIESELGYLYDPTSEEYKQLENWEKILIPKASSHNNLGRTPYTLYDKGRLPLQNKVKFMNGAQKEIVEFGLRLNTFVNYFYSRSEFEFRQHIRNLLKMGVNIKLYLIDPDSNEAGLYFRDRARVQIEEVESIEIIQRVKEKLRRIQSDLNRPEYKGNLEFYTYKHIPSSHFLLIDGETLKGKILITNYLYGIPRADCPIIEVSKQSNRELYRTYFLSYKALISGAKKLDFPQA